MKRTAKALAMILAVAMIITMFPLTASAASKKPGKVKISKFSVSSVSTSTNTCKVTIKWKKVKNATGYQIYYKRGSDPWVKQAKVGKKYRAYTITGVPAGNYQFKVRAIRKIKKKTYKGSFSKVKAKFIASPLTFEKLPGSFYRDGYVPKYQGVPYTISGNTVTYTEDITGESIPEEEINKWFDDQTAAFKAASADIMNYTGVSGVRFVYNLTINGSVAYSRTY